MLVAVPKSAKSQFKQTEENKRTGRGELNDRAKEKLTLRAVKAFILRSRAASRTALHFIQYPLH